MVNVVLLVVFLHYGLCNDLFSWNGDLFHSSNILSLNWFHYWLQNYFFVIPSVHLHIYFLSLEYWLINSLLVDFVAWLHYDFFSVVLSYHRLFGKRFQIEEFIFRGHELNIFLIIDYLFLINRLEVDGLIWVFVLSVNDLLRVLDWFGDVRKVFYSVVSLHYSHSVFNSHYGGLTDSFLDDGVTRRCNGNISHNSFIVYLSVLSNLFSIDWSLSIGLLDDGSLDNSLFDNRLRNNFSCNNRLS